MKTNYCNWSAVRGSFLVVLLVLGAAFAAQAQRAPGWAWAKTFGGSTATFFNDIGGVTGMGCDAAGNVYVAGTFIGGNSFAAATTFAGLGESDAFVAKYTPAGALLWVRVLASTGTDRAYALVVAPNGTCAVAGEYGGQDGSDLPVPGGPVLQGARNYRQSTGVGISPTARFPFVVSYDAQGTLRWANRFAPTENMRADKLLLDAVGNLYINGNIGPQTFVFGGQTYPAIGATNGATNLYLAKISPTGGALWARRVGMPASDLYNMGMGFDGTGALYWSLGISGAGTLAIDGKTAVIGSRGESVLVKLTDQNAVKWLRNPATGSTGPDQDQWVAVGNYDPAANTFLFQAPLYANSSLTLRGIAQPFRSAAAAELLLGRLDTSGTVTQAAVWATSLNGLQTLPNIAGLLPGPQGSITLVGQPNDGFTLTSTGQLDDTHQGDIFVMRQPSLTAAPLWTRYARMNNPFSYYHQDVAAAVLDAQDNVYVAGTVFNTAQFGAVPVQPVRRGYRPDGLLAKLDMLVPTATRATAAGLPWAAYPNPATGAVQLSGLPAGATVALLDGAGRRVRTLRLPATAPAAAATLSLHGLAAGLYTLHVSGTAAAYRAQRLTVE